MGVHRQNLLGLTRQELADLAVRLGQPAYRGAQLFGWLYERGASDLGAMTNIGKAFRALLEEHAGITGISLLSHQRSSADATTKFLFGLQDGLRIESVLIPPASAFRPGEASADDEQTRLTLCVSTQVGCPLDCAFCATGSMGFLRNLTAGEIVDQVLQVRRQAGRRITNIVFMGMGEPLLNYDSVMAASEIMTAGLGIAARHITISTAGRADRIRRLADEHRRLKLAVSLHSAVEETRTHLMPITRNFGLAALRSALEHYYAVTRQRVTYEVILFDGINDSDREVSRLIAFARHVPCKINVIPFHAIDVTHPTGFAASLRPSPRAEEIVRRMREEHLTVMVRSSAGEDIDAACGQLVVSTGPRGARRRSQHSSQSR